MLIPDKCTVERLEDQVRDQMMDVLLPLEMLPEECRRIKIIEVWKSTCFFSPKEKLAMQLCICFKDDRSRRRSTSPGKQQDEKDKPPQQGEFKPAPPPRQSAWQRGPPEKPTPAASQVCPICMYILDMCEKFSCLI